MLKNEIKIINSWIKVLLTIIAENKKISLFISIRYLLI